MLSAMGPAQAGGWDKHHWGKHRGYGGHHHYRHAHYRHGHYRHHRYHRRHRGHDDDTLIIGGILGGVLLGSALSQPRPAPPYRYDYYAPPPPDFCEQDQVYRYLPDGRIQWGTRTRCY
ncbi:hypothetical protein [Pelagibius marinus]|uniref:hypothetical protein n=1 Tax=Pelagibius marinus TaxID=2762760 RepID=UPI001872EAC6|nr:hypothetical protein [Pelagibius marinus]